MSAFTTYFKDALKQDPSIKTEVLSKYPIYDEGYRDSLNELICDHFHNREIGHETISMFKLALKTRLRLIMPVINEHYKTTLKLAGLDPLQTVNMVNTGTSKASTTNTTDSTSASKNGATANSVTRDYPQTAVNQDGEIFAVGSVTNTSGAEVESSAGETTKGEQEQGNESRVTGSSGHASTLLFQHRQTLVNVDQMVLDELEELFMGVLVSGDSFSNSRGVTAYGYGPIFGY